MICFGLCLPMKIVHMKFGNKRAYQQEKVDFELYKTDGMNVRGRALYPYLSIINNSYKNRDDHDANIVNKLIEIVVKLTNIKFPVEGEQSQLVH